MNSNPLLPFSPSATVFPPVGQTIIYPSPDANKPAQLVYFKNPHAVNRDVGFIALFMAELAATPEVIDALVGLGDFQNNMHNIAVGCSNNKEDCGGCENCYSDDTNHEMSNVRVLGPIWKRAYDKWCKITGHQPATVDSDAEDEAGDSSSSE